MDRLTKVLTSQYNRYIRQPEDNIIVVMDDANIKRWYALILGNHEPYHRAEILFMFKVPDEYPHKPPSVECLTPNGIFELGGPLCVSISEFHRESWVKSLGITGYAKQLWNALLCFSPDDTINSIRVTWTSPETRQSLANQSRAYNEKCNKEVYDLVNVYVETHPEFAAVKLLEENRNSMDTSE
jgi:ubiquitin-conjugating enzyme E2 J2